MLAPTLIGLGAFFIWPMIQTLYYSFTTWGGFGTHTWTGVQNYRSLAHDPNVVGALENTLILTAISLLGVPLAVMVAALLNRPNMHGLAIYRTLYFLPVVALPAAVALVWELLYDGNGGLINWILGQLHIHGKYWLSDPSVALYAIGAVAVWGSIGFNMVVLLGGLQSIPTQYYEAAQLDGAGKLRQFFSVTVPLLTPAIFFVTVMSVINSMQIFDLIYLMIGKSNPALQNTQTIVYLFYKTAFEDNNGGYASAIAFELLGLILVVTLVQFGLQKRWVHYEQ